MTNNEAIEAAKCREEFEKWFCQGKNNCPSINRCINGGDGYNLMSAHQSWQAWKAAWNTRQNAGAANVEALKNHTWGWVHCGEMKKIEPSRYDKGWNDCIDELSRRGLLKSQEGAGKIIDTPIRNDATTPLTDEEIRAWTFMNMDLLINDKYKDRNFPLFMSKLLTEVVDRRKAVLSQQQGEE